MIGGTDVILSVRKDLPAPEIIARTVRRHWPGVVFQNVDDESVQAPASSGPPQPTGAEFFLYRDEQAARSWEKHGAIPANANTMLHVIVGKPVQGNSPVTSLTLVCDELSGEMKAIVDDIRAAFRDFATRAG